jgi:predicted ferric reductase
MSSTINWIPVIVVTGIGAFFAINSINVRCGFLLHRKLRNFLPFHPSLEWIAKDVYDLSLGEMLSILLFVGFLCLRFATFYKHLEVFRSIGEVNFMTLAFVALPVSKHSIWLPILGISFERAIKFHRFWGILTILIMGVHGFAMLITYANGMQDPMESINYALRFVKNMKGWSNLSGLLSFALALTMAITALPVVRRKCFEVFYFVHIAFAPLVFIFAGLHMPTLITWMYLSIVLCGIDYTMRFYNSYLKSAKICGIKVIPLTSDSSRVVRLSISTLPGKFTYEPGQYFFLTIPAISSLVSHPFSTSAPITHHVKVKNGHEVTADVITFHIKDMGPGTWTHLLANLHEEATVYIDGPFGRPYIPLQEYTALVLCCGGKK